ncbi:MAG: type 1 glutamine amidotransferase [Alphaproteobacteria bacterium]|nr:MAG: type 1 glutamine amidotransferase [Alphaproteobacteria bacterium]
MADQPRFIVVDGYAREGREELARGGATPAGELYARMLKECAPGCHVDIVYPADPDSALPSGAAIAQYDGIAWTGSSLTIYADDPKVAPQIEFARAAFEARVPSFGSCWAAQIAVVAAGGLCAANPRGREMGIARKIALTPEGRAHPLYTGKKSVFDAFISHEDEVTHLPPGASVLASNDFCRVQAVSVVHKGGVFWGLQYHPEYDLHELARLCYCRKQRLVDKGFFKDLDAAQAYVDLLETLHQDPGRRDIAWLLGIDEDVMNEDVRRAEVRNWINLLVVPAIRQRR